MHPDDEYASVHENGSLGKTECWYILDCDEDASIVVGHNAKDKAELVDMINGGRWDDFIRLLPIKRGDFIQIDPGTVHAIKGGTLLLETQQSSDITYRVYDYGRLQNGKPRQLHIEQSMDVIKTPAAPPEESVVHMAEVPVNAVTLMHSCKYYSVYRVNVKGAFDHELDVPFTIMSVVSGEGKINGISVKKGDHFILSNNVKHITFEGEFDIIASHI